MASGSRRTGGEGPTPQERDDAPRIERDQDGPRTIDLTEGDGAAPLGAEAARQLKRLARKSLKRQTRSHLRR